MTTYTHNATIYSTAGSALTAMIEDWCTANGTTHPAEALDNLNSLPESLSVMVREWQREDWGADWLAECDQDDYEASIMSVRIDLEMALAEEQADAREQWLGL